MRVVILRREMYELWVPFHELQSILQAENKITSCKLFLASCKLLFTSCKFKEIISQVASCVFWVENLKFYLTSCQLFFYELKVSDDNVYELWTYLPFKSWTFKMPFLRITVTYLNQYSRK